MDAQRFVTRNTETGAAQGSHAHGAFVRDRHYRAIGSVLFASHHAGVRAGEEVPHVIVGSLLRLRMLKKRWAQRHAGEPFFACLCFHMSGIIQVVPSIDSGDLPEMEEGF